MDNEQKKYKPTLEYRTQTKRCEVFTKIQCVKFIVQDIPFMLVVPLFSSYLFCVRVMLVCVCAGVFFFCSSFSWLAFISCYCWCLFICLPLLLFVALQRIIWHMAFRLSFCSVLFRSALSPVYGWKMCTPMEKSSETIMSAQQQRQHPKLEQEHLVR